MSDYMYLLDSHLSQEQNQLLTVIQNAAAELGISLYLTGGAMRDMLGGFPIRDLDFTFEGQPPAKILRVVETQMADLQVEEDAVRKSAELRMPTGVSASLRMARTQKVAKAGTAGKIAPAQLLEDLAQRDFTINAIALSLAKASRGLIRDPMNGVSDLQNREIRVGYPNAFFDEPVRLVRAIRLRHRMGFQLEERTQRYFNTGVEDGWIRTVTAEQWAHELRLIADEHAAAEILRELDAVKLLPAAGEAVMNLEGLVKFQNARRMVPGRGTQWPLFLHVLTEEMKPKERTAFLAAFGLTSDELEVAKKIKMRAAKLAEDLASPALRKPSQVYNALAPAEPSDILLVLYESSHALVLERLNLYLDKYISEASEITDAQVEATGVKPGTAQFRKAKAALITARLNAPPPPPPAPVVPGGPMAGAGAPPVRAVR